MRAQGWGVRKRPAWVPPGHQGKTGSPRPLQPAPVGTSSPLRPLLPRCPPRPASAEVPRALAPHPVGLVPHLAGLVPQQAERGCRRQQAQEECGAGGTAPPAPAGPLAAAHGAPTSEGGRDPRVM